MIVDKVVLRNFRCFGPVPTSVQLDPCLTALIGANGAGKTALLQALLRLFGTTGEQRKCRRQDFHVPIGQGDPPTSIELSIEVYLSFPELESNSEKTQAIPQFFHQMATDEDGELKCRLRLEATWTDDGSIDGAIDDKYMAVLTLKDEFTEDQCQELRGADRARIQMLYIPANRDASSQVNNLLRGRLWRSIKWSQQLQKNLQKGGDELNAAFSSEIGVKTITDRLKERWSEVNFAGTETVPAFHSVDTQIQDFARRVGVIFESDELGRPRPVEELSDGQRSLFHIAMTAATLDVEASITREEPRGFDPGTQLVPSLTIIAVEEPENSLAPFYLSRIIDQLQDLTKTTLSQALVSSHSTSVLSRIDPSQIRYLRLDPSTRTSAVREIELPQSARDAAKYIREAIRVYPELYFARFVILGEGASEEIVIPRLAEALGMPIDRSFVAVVPLGGRHVNHIWRLLAKLDIPHATLLDLDLGRKGGGWGRIKSSVEQLSSNGHSLETLMPDNLTEGADKVLSFFDSPIGDYESLKMWMGHLSTFGVFFSSPLDLDMSMLQAFPSEYKALEAGEQGPSDTGDALKAVLGDSGTEEFKIEIEDYKWYRYLFLSRAKPGTHFKAMSQLDEEKIKDNTPDEIRKLISQVSAQVASHSYDREGK